MKEYCADCLGVFEPEELNWCMCDDFMSPRERTIVTKYGVKHEIIENKYCKSCLETKHQHYGEVFI